MRPLAIERLPAPRRGVVAPIHQCLAGMLERLDRCARRPVACGKNRATPAAPARAASSVEPASSFCWNHRSKARARKPVGFRLGELFEGRIDARLPPAARAGSARRSRGWCRWPLLPAVPARLRDASRSPVRRRTRRAPCRVPARSRIFSSPAALWVKVTATIFCTGVPVASTRTMRRISSEVLPVPAEASTIRLSPSELRMRSRAASSLVWMAGNHGMFLRCLQGVQRHPAFFRAVRRSSLGPQTGR